MAATHGRPFVWPDPLKRSIHEPAEEVSYAKIVGLYNQAHPHLEARSNFSEQIGKWFKDEAFKRGWAQAIKGVNGYTLVADIELIRRRALELVSGSNVTPIGKRKSS